MMHYLLGNEKFGILFSNPIIENGKKSIRIYADECIHDLNELEFYLPDYNITMNKGFSEEGIKEIFQHVKCCESIIWDIAENGE